MSALATAERAHASEAKVDKSTKKEPQKRINQKAPDFFGAFLEAISGVVRQGIGVDKEEN